MTTPLSAHGTIVAVQLTPGGAFTDIAELGDLQLPETMRNEFDSTVHNRNIDSYVLGVFRRGSMALPLNFIPDNNTHDHLTGLYKLQIDNTITGYRARIPTGGAPVDWIMSGQVQSLKPGTPVDGKLALDATLRFSGYMSIGGVLIGA